MTKPVLDFVRHELQVGDIVIYGSGMGMYFARITGFEGAQGYHGIMVTTLGLGADPQAPNNYKYWEPEMLVWYSSDYRDVPDRLVMDILDYEGRYGRHA